MFYTDGCGPVVSKLERRKRKKQREFYYKGKWGIMGHFLKQRFLAP
jgi:hypothetical protein